MPVQQIIVKNSSEIENFEWNTVPYMPGTRHGSRAGSSSSQTSNSNSSGDICRICHCESDAQNPLLAPCYCSGSLKYVHQSCLQQWLTASDTRSCELCKFHFIMHTKIKPFNEWRRLEMSGVERRRLCCAVLFHCVAALCVMWSLFVLIDRAAEEIQQGRIAWPFWTKLMVVAVGFTGGAVFMYIQCRQYFTLCSRWRCHNSRNLRIERCHLRGCRVLQLYWFDKETALYVIEAITSLLKVLIFYGSLTPQTKIYVLGVLTTQQYGTHQKLKDRSRLEINAVLHVAVT